MTSAFQQVLFELESRGQKLAIAESLTGGLLTSHFVDIDGASKVLLGSVTAYQDSVKSRLLGVDATLLAEKTAVSAEVALAMLIGVRDLFSKNTQLEVDQIAAIATTGFASDWLDGQAKLHKAGQVFIALVAPGKAAVCAELKLTGSRDEIRAETAVTAATLLRDYLTD